MIVAVLGTGSIGTRHLEALSKVARVETIAVPVRQERYEEFHSKGIAAARTIAEAVQRGARLCVVATDTRRHTLDSLEAIQFGCDVLVEKPISIAVAAAIGVYRAAKEAQRKLFVACVLRFSESLNAFKDLLPNVGRLHSIRIECQSYLPAWQPARNVRDTFRARPEEGGVLLDLIHEIDYACWLYDWPSAVYARLRNMGRLEIQAEESAELICETPGGCVVSIALDYLSRPPRRVMAARGEHGTITWDGVSGTVTLERVGNAATSTKSDQTRDDMMYEQATAFIAAAVGTVDARLVSAEDGIRAVAICDAARRSSDTLRREEIRYPST